MKIKFIQKAIDSLRKKDNIFLKDNKLFLPDNFDQSKLRLKIKGKNNTVIIKRDCQIQNRLTIRGFCDDSIIEIGENFRCVSVDIVLGQEHQCFGKIKNVKISIGNNCSWESGLLLTFNSYSTIEIGDDCMFAYNVTVYNTDAHPVFNYETGKLINHVDTLHIGNHVWLGMNATVLKNSYIPDDCIVGWGAVYSGMGGGYSPIPRCVCGQSCSSCQEQCFVA